MSQQDIAAAKAARRSTLKSLKAKRESRIKSIHERAAEEIRQVNIQFAADPERMRAKYAADAAYKSEKAKRRAAKAQAKAEKRIAYEIKLKQEERLFSIGEEIFNSITIGIGAGLSVAALILLIVKAAGQYGSPIFARTVVSYAVSGTFLLVLYLMSTFAHALPSYSAKRVFRILSYDFGFGWVASMLSLIALVVITGKLGWILFGIVWVLCIFSIAFYSAMEGRQRGRKIGMKICLPIAVIAVAVEVTLLAKVAIIPAKLFILAIASILIGELFHSMKKIRWTNTIFHLMAIIADAFCFFALYLII